MQALSQTAPNSRRAVTPVLEKVTQGQPRVPGAPTAGGPPPQSRGLPPPPTRPSCGIRGSFCKRLLQAPTPAPSIKPTHSVSAQTRDRHLRARSGPLPRWPPSHSSRGSGPPRSVRRLDLPCLLLTDSLHFSLPRPQWAPGIPKALLHPQHRDISAASISICDPPSRWCSSPRLFFTRLRSLSSSGSCLRGLHPPGMLPSGARPAHRAVGSSLGQRRHGGELRPPARPTLRCGGCP